MRGVREEAGRARERRTRVAAEPGAPLDEHDDGDAQRDAVPRERRLLDEPPCRPAQRRVGRVGPARRVRAALRRQGVALTLRAPGRLARRALLAVLARRERRQDRQARLARRVPRGAARRRGVRGARARVVRVVRGEGRLARAQEEVAVVGPGRGCARRVPLVRGREALEGVGVVTPARGGRAGVRGHGAGAGRRSCSGGRATRPAAGRRWGGRRGGRGREGEGSTGGEVGCSAVWSSWWLGW